jgi:hypothetical protein
VAPKWATNVLSNVPDDGMPNGVLFFSIFTPSDLFLTMRKNQAVVAGDRLD